LSISSTALYDVLYESVMKENKMREIETEVLLSET